MDDGRLPDLHKPGRAVGPWHRLAPRHPAWGRRLGLHVQLQLSIKFPKIALHITPKSIFILNVVFVKLAVHI